MGNVCVDKDEKKTLAKNESIKSKEIIEINDLINHS